MPLIQNYDSKTEASTNQTKEQLLTVSNLRTYFYTLRGVVKAVDGVSFEIRRREILGLVGESGSGKSVTALSIMRLVPDPPGRIAEGQVALAGMNLTKISEKEMRSVRGSRISMIFQDPLSSLDPVAKVGDQIAETIRAHDETTNRDGALKKAAELVRLVGISDSEMRLQQYPFQLSGGMRQRMMIAMALASKPALLIADEPTTNLDVTIQAQILNLLREVRTASDMSILLITHNLGVVAWLCDRVIVMYAGKIVEQAPVDVIFYNPKHPYTQALLNTVPSIDRERTSLDVIEGEVPSLTDVPPGCRFHPRCPHAQQICSDKEPESIQLAPDHKVCCVLYRAKIR